VKSGRFGAALALAAASAALAQAPPPSSDPPAPGPNLGGLDKGGPQGERRTEIASALAARDYDRAETLLLEAVEQEPRSPDLLRLLGGVFFVKGRHLNAAIAFKKAEALAPLDERSRFTLVMAYVVLGHRDWARPELAKLTAATPRNALYVYWTARLDYDDGQYAAAIRGFEHVLELDPRFAKAHDNLGLSHEALGQHDEAIRSYQEAVRLNREQKPPSPWPPLNLGLLLTRLDRAEEAEALFRESVRCDERFPQARYQLGMVLDKKGQTADAVAELEAASRLDPAYPEPHYALSRLYRRAGEQEKADRALETFQRLKKEKGQTGSGR
jgi:tetratricopeptide (TPR) repeat protein